MTTTPRRHYAVLDPDNPQQMTYWRDTPSGWLDVWPPKAQYGPVFYRKDVPKDRDQAAKFRQACLAKIQDWDNRVRAAIDADLVAAGKRFAEMTSRCCWCGRTLTDDRSKVYGIGPECRRGIPDEALAQYLTPKVGRAHAETLENS